MTEKDRNAVFTDLFIHWNKLHDACPECMPKKYIDFIYEVAAAFAILRELKPRLKLHPSTYEDKPVQLLCGKGFWYDNDFSLDQIKEWLTFEEVEEDEET